MQACTLVPSSTEAGRKVLLKIGCDLTNVSAEGLMALLVRIYRSLASEANPL